MDLSRRRFMGEFLHCRLMDFTPWFKTSNMCYWGVSLFLLKCDLSCCRLGLWLLSQVKPSEIFLKSISKEVTSVEVIYPSRLVPALFRCTLAWLMDVLFEVLLFGLFSFQFG